MAKVEDDINSINLPTFQEMSLKYSEEFLRVLCWYVKELQVSLHDEDVVKGQ